MGEGVRLGSFDKGIFEGEFSIWFRNGIHRLHVYSVFSLSYLNVYEYRGNFSSRMMGIGPHRTLFNSRITRRDGL